MRKHGRAHARAAHLGQGDRASTLGQAAFESSLARRRLALPSHEAIAKQNFGHQLCTEFGTRSGSLYCCFDGGTAKVMR
jgi:hypothetical protein